MWSEASCYLKGLLLKDRRFSSLARQRMQSGVWRPPLLLVLLFCHARAEEFSFNESWPIAERCEVMMNEYMKGCMQSVVGIVPLPNGVVPLQPGDRIACPSVSCKLMPSRPEWTGLESCMLVLNKTCTPLASNQTGVLGFNTCCQDDEYGSNFLNMLPLWKRVANSEVENLLSISYWGVMTVKVPPNALPMGAVMAVFDMVVTPAMVPSPPRYAMISSIGVVVVDQVPLKKIVISYVVKDEMGYFQDVWFVKDASRKECMRRKVLEESELAVFYYDKALAKWLSFGGEGHVYNRTDMTVRAEVKPEILARNNLALFVGVMMGIPKAQGSQQQYTLPSVGLQSQEVFRERWFDETRPGEICIFPVPVNANETAKMAEQGFTALGAPYMLKLDDVSDNIVAVIPMPPVDSQYFSGGGGGGNGRRRVLLQSAQNVIEAFVFPAFFNATGQEWQNLTGCMYRSSDRVYICNMSGSFIAENGMQVMYVNLIGTEVYNSATRSPLPPPTTTTTPVAAEIPFEPVSSNTMNVIWAVVGAVVFVLIMCCVVRRCFHCRYRNTRRRKPNGQQQQNNMRAAVGELSKDVLQHLTARQSAAAGYVTVPVLEADADSFFR